MKLKSKKVSRSSYTPKPCWLFRNNGNGTFTDVSKEAGISKSLANAWGVAAAEAQAMLAIVDKLNQEQARKRQQALDQNH